MDVIGSNLCFGRSNSTTATAFTTISTNRKSGLILRWDTILNISSIFHSFCVSVFFSFLNLKFLLISNFQAGSTSTHLILMNWQTGWEQMYIMRSMMRGITSVREKTEVGLISSILSTVNILKVLNRIVVSMICYFNMARRVSEYLMSWFDPSWHAFKSCHE